MADAMERITKAAEQLKQQRDELRVKLHLGKAEAKDEWTRLEKQWEEVKPKLDTVREEAGKTAESVGTALSLALEELKNGYERLRNRL
jgi:predicted nuclease with TOPRIM domain